MEDDLQKKWKWKTSSIVLKMKENLNLEKKEDSLKLFIWNKHFCQKHLQYLFWEIWYLERFLIDVICSLILDRTATPLFKEKRIPIKYTK